jgi:hypothetical protein
VHLPGVASTVFDAFGERFSLTAVSAVTTKMGLHGGWSVLRV